MFLLCFSGSSIDKPEAKMVNNSYVNKTENEDLELHHDSSSVWSHLGRDDHDHRRGFS